MQQIDIDFDVFKELTLRRQHERHTYNEVLRDLLGLKPSLGRGLSDALASGFSSGIRKAFKLRDGELVEGTQLRAIYKGNEYRAVIRNGEWIDQDGIVQTSPSGAASAICGGTNVNGLRFWHAKRPTDQDFTRLDILMARR